MKNIRTLRTATLLLPVAAALLAATFSAVPAIAQGGGDNDPDRAVSAGGQFPAGWSARPDRGTASQIVFTLANNVFHFTMGPAATFSNPGWTKSGDYKFSARVSQVKAPTHPVSYGLMIGGSSLAGDNPLYSYFLVRNQGEFFIANREGAQRPVIVDWTANPVIHKQAADGKQSNVLGIQVQGADVIFTVNGTEVTKLPKSKLHTDGLNGFRVGHNIDVEIDQVSR